ncbi:MAG: FGGY family carbohydrate kinase [Acidimicrobiales bacterium]
MRVLAIDQGTSATKAVVFGDHGETLASVEAGVTPRAVPGGGVEQDPEQLWESVCEAGRGAVARAGGDVAAVGFANQGETVLAWDRSTGRPLSTAISWQDRRAATICAELAAAAGDLTRTTGLPLDPYFAAPKMQWLRRHVTDEGVVTTSDAWLVHRLTGAYVTDVTTASRTMLLDLGSRTWSAPACAAFGLDPADLPEVVGSAQAVGHTEAFGPSLPVTGLSVDQQAALVGEHCLEPGESKCTYGTGAFLLANAGPRPVLSSGGLAVSVAWQLDDGAAYCMDGQVYAAGAAVGWLQRWGFLRRPQELDTVAGSVNGGDGVIVVPALTGLGAPWWQPDALASITGIGPATEPAHVVRATLEGLAAQVTLLARAAAVDLGRPLALLRVDGGLTRSRVLMQTQADLLQIPIEVASSPHATAAGVGALARLGAGSGATLADAIRWDEPDARYEPAIGPDEADERLARFERAVARIDATRPTPRPPS